jgi:succinyl-CoA synthetase alpha subunit
MLRVKERLKTSSAWLIGPNCPGVITPGQCNIGIMPASIYQPGKIGVISRSGTLFYEAVDQLCREGFGQSTCVGIGADVVPGMDFVDCLELFKTDPHTQAVMLIGEIGGAAEEDAAEYLSASDYPKPVIAYIAGRHAPPHRRMGHSSAIISAGKGGTEKKIQALRDAGVSVVESPVEFGITVRRAIR